MKKIIILFCLLSWNSFALEQSCGKYKIYGKVKRGDDTFYLIVNSGSKSEYSFKVPLTETPKIVPFQEFGFMALVKVNKFKAYNAEIESVESIERSVEYETSYLKLDAMTLLEKNPCR